MILDELTYEQCVAQGVGPMVFPARLEQGIDPSHSAQMKMICLHTMQQQVKLQHVLSMAWTALTEAGIRPVLMKGAGLAALYPSPEQRSWGDIDLFVGIDQYHPACQVMRAAFPNALRFEEELDHYKHYNLIADGISIEIHRVSIGLQHPLDARRYAKIEAYGMMNAVPLTISHSPIAFQIPEPTFNALFVFMHSWEHMTTLGANIRQLCDLSLLLHHYRDTIDRNRLAHDLKALHLTDVWQLYMYLLVRHLDLPEDEAPLYDKGERVKARGERLLTDLLNGKMVAPASTEAPHKNRIARKWHTMRERLRNADRIGQYSPAYARHMKAETFLHGALRFFAKDRHWE
jgi:hypothetical protein